MRLPSWIKAKRAGVTETHVHYNITIDDAELAKRLAPYIQRELILAERRSAGTPNVKLPPGWDLQIVRHDEDDAA